MNYRELIKILEKNGFQFIRQNGTSHAIFYNGKTSVVVPKHRGDIPIGTCKAILKQAGLKK